MSKLDEIVELIHGSDCPYTKPCPVVNQGKRAVKELMLELIDGLDDIQMLDAPDENALFEQAERQELRYSILSYEKAKLRKKIEEL